MTEIAVRYSQRADRTIGAFVIDEADAAVVDRVPYWYMTKAGYVYTMRETGRFVWLTTILLLKKVGFVIDHVNRCPMDNRRENLRHVTHTDNMANTAVRRHSKSGIKGVRFHAQSGLWQARIMVNGRSVGLGYYHEAYEAAAVFLTAHRYYHPDLYPGFEMLWKIVGLQGDNPWGNRAAGRKRTSGGQYAVEERPYAD